MNKAIRSILKPIQLYLMDRILHLEAVSVLTEDLEVATLH